MNSVWSLFDLTGFKWTTVTARHASKEQHTEKVYTVYSFINCLKTLKGLSWETSLFWQTRVPWEPSLGSIHRRCCPLICCRPNRKQSDSAISAGAPSIEWRLESDFLGSIEWAVVSQQRHCGCKQVVVGQIQIFCVWWNPDRLHHSEQVIVVQSDSSNIRGSLVNRDGVHHRNNGKLFQSASELQNGQIFFIVINQKMDERRDIQSLDPRHKLLMRFADWMPGIWLTNPVMVICDVCWQKQFRSMHLLFVNEEQT